MSKLAALVVVLTLALPGTAHADSPYKVREPLTLFDHQALAGFCDFTVTETDRVRGNAVPIQTLRFDAEGNLTRVDIHGGGVSSTFEANGKSITVNNSGPVTVIFNEDGSVTVYQRGQSTSADQGLITGEPFFIHQSGTLVTIAVFNPQTGFFDYTSQVRNGVTTDLCAALS